MEQMEQYEEIEEKEQKNGYWSGLLSGLLLALLLFGCIFVGKLVLGIFYPKKIVPDFQVENAELLDENTKAKVEVIEKIIGQYYLEETDNVVMKDGIYSGIVNALGDPYSVYYSA